LTKKVFLQATTSSIIGETSGYVASYVILRSNSKPLRIWFAILCSQDNRHDAYQQIRRGAMKHLTYVVTSAVMIILLALPGSAVLAVPQSSPAMLACSGLPIASGQARAGFIGSGTPQMTYCFSASAGQDVAIAMNASGGSALDPWLFLYDPDGRQVADNDDRTSGRDLNSFISMRLPRTGSYTIKASRYGISWGNYEISLTVSGSSGNGGSQGCYNAPGGTDRNDGPVTEGYPSQYGYCECVTWIIRKFDLCRFPGYGNAKTLDQQIQGGIWMERNGFYRVNASEIRPGDVVVLQAGAAQAGSEGHIGYVNSYPYGNRYVQMVSANWYMNDPNLRNPNSRALREEDGCGNVTSFELNIANSSGMSFWRHR
jgi:hypothetical protein